MLYPAVDQPPVFQQNLKSLTWLTVRISGSISQFPIVVAPPIEFKFIGLAIFMLTPDTLGWVVASKIIVPPLGTALVPAASVLNGVS
jgi:hypothetical protein